jgi:outer membrane receptor protein involved in Fe transport
VARDSYGQVHVRGEHANLQYRINGVLLPEGLDAFGQVIDARIADRVQFLTGALPAQYGYRTAGVVDIQTKSGAFEQGGVSDLTVGSDGSWHPSLTYAGHSGNMNYFLSGDYLSSDYGIETPTAAYHPIHDATTQGKGFGYVSYLLNPTNRLNVIFGTSTNNYQIPNNPDQTPSYTVAGAGIVNSRDLKETQFEQSHYGTIALQGTDGDWGYQIAPYIRYSQTHYHPDTVGDLEYTGVATDVLRSDLALGLQGDGSWRANDHHTLRAGVMAQHEPASTADNAQTFLADDDGNQSSDTPITITDDHHKEGVLAGVYLQDEWTITDWLTMNYGARFDQVNAYVDENQLSPRLGFVIKATPTTTLHAGYARYFTPPPLELIDNSTISAFSGTTAQTETSKNDAVRAERSHSFDVGITQKLGDHMQMGVDSYYKLVRNMLDEGQFGSALIYTPFNYAKGRIYGVETTFSYTADSWDGYVNLAASRAMGKDIISGQENFSQDELDYISGHWVHLDHDQTFTASIGGTYRPREGTKLSADAILGSGLREGFANTGHLPGYGTINLGATQHVGIDARGFDVHLSLINLFDKDYELRDGSGIGVGAPQWGQRRTFYLGITRTF